MQLICIFHSFICLLTCKELDFFVADAFPYDTQARTQTHENKDNQRFDKTKQFFLFRWRSLSLSFYDDIFSHKILIIEHKIYSFRNGNSNFRIQK